MTEKLLPCPFCGGKVITTQEDCYGYIVDWNVYCKHCELYMGIAKQYTQEEAVAAWNKRAPLQAKRPLIYVASPYGGRHENFVRAEHDMLRLTETYRQYDFISPIISFAFAYNIYDYEKGINICLALLARCQQMWVLHDDGASKGVKIEREFAAEHNIPIKEMSETV